MDWDEWMLHCSDIMAYSDRAYVVAGPEPIKFNCSCLSSHISCRVKVQRNIICPGPGPVKALNKP